MLPTPLRPSLVTLPNEVVNLIIKENVNFKINSQDFDFEARRRTELVSYAQLSTIWRYEAQLELFHRPEILGLEGVERLVTCLESAEGRLDGFAQELSLKGGNYGESEDLSKLLIRVQGVKELEMTQLEVNAELISLLPSK